MMTYFDDEKSLISEVRGGVPHNLQDCIKPLSAGCECDARLGWLMDYADISDAFKPLLDRLDHYYLNEITGLENATSENLAKWIWDRLKPKVPLLTEIVVAETCMSRCVYRGQ